MDRDSEDWWNEIIRENVRQWQKAAAAAKDLREQIDRPWYGLTAPVPDTDKPWFINSRKETPDPMNALQQLRTFDVDTADMATLVCLSIFGHQLADGFVARGVPAPDWVNDNLTKIDREINSKRRDELERALKLAQGKLDGLKSAEEKRVEAKAEVDRITALLSGAPAPAAGSNAGS